MAKRKIRSLPKRIAGVKIPKGLRRYADTPLGAALIAEAMVEFGKEALLSPPVRQAAAEVRNNVAKTGLAIAMGLQHAAQSAGNAITDASESPSRKSRRNALSPRLRQEEAAAH